VELAEDRKLASSAVDSGERIDMGKQVFQFALQSGGFQSQTLHRTGEQLVIMYSDRRTFSSREQEAGG
jgi:hypothetical protein